ncbi:MAG: response regulator transcription factor, partial [Flavobacteriaceae bacterium]
VFGKAIGQYQFSGKLPEEKAHEKVYLSLVEDYRKMGRFYTDQIIAQTHTDSTGHFVFKGADLPQQNRIYRLHTDDCPNGTAHFLKDCHNSKSVLFIADGRDTLDFPTGFEEEVFCTVRSTNTSSDALLQVDLLKEAMIFDFMDIEIDKRKDQLLEKWFDLMHDFGKKAQEPLVELYIYEFLSNKGHETHPYYQKDALTNPYYQGLLQRLEQTYPKARFTQQYMAEITMDTTQPSDPSRGKFPFVWLFYLAIASSSIAVIWILLKRRKKKGRIGHQMNKLTAQEREIARLILKGHTNKEIAAALFISVSTVKTHVNNVYKKLDISSREEFKTQYSH